MIVRLEKSMMPDVADIRRFGLSTLLLCITFMLLLSPMNARAATAKPCQRPPDDYRRTIIRGETVNVRTLWMLRLADKLYQGPGSPLRVVQGSYTDDVAASFGTHAGGGVVDISIRAKSAPHDVLSLEEANKIVLALRQAGFAAWLRMPDDLDPPTTLHIHAVAVGDSQLSEAAKKQLYGSEGYFAGYDGVPPEQGGTRRDRHGGPLICDWMIEDGFVESRFSVQLWP